MHTCNGFCQACNKLVALVIDEGASLAKPLLLTAVGGALGAATGRGKDRLVNAIIGAAVTGGISFAAHALKKPAQRWICGDCRCEHVLPMAA